MLLLCSSMGQATCPDPFISIEGKCFHFTESTNNFVECAEKCAKENSTLPCIESEEENEAIANRSGVEKEIAKEARSKSVDSNIFDRYWVGLYQTPQTFHPKKDWDNWQRRGCDSSHLNWEKSQPLDAFNLQESCAIAQPKNDAKWYDYPCWFKDILCVCQYNGTSSESFKKDSKALLENQNKFNNAIGITTMFLNFIFSFLVLGYSIYTFRKMKYTQQRRKKIVIIILFALSSIVFNFIELIPYNEVIDLIASIYSGLLCCFTIWIIISQTFSLFDSIILAIGGVREARKPWTKLLRLFMYAYLAASIVGGLFLLKFDPLFQEGKEYLSINMYLSMKLIDSIWHSASFIFIGYAFIQFVLCVMLKKNSTKNNASNLPLWKFINREDHDKSKNTKINADYDSLRQFKNTKRINHIQIITLFWATSLTLFAMLHFLIELSSAWIFPLLHSQSIMFYFSLAFVLFAVLLWDINDTERHGRNNFEKKSLYWESIKFSKNMEQGENIYSADGEDLGTAPPVSSRPNSVFTSITNKGEHRQANIDPENWTITIHNFIQFLELCVGTQTWLALAIAKGGDQYITMHDVNTHFVIPWTRDTGCSIALLFDSNPEKADLMISHSWSGSVKETINAMKTLITMHFLPIDSRLFFCTLSQYQAEDGAHGGLSIQQQLEMNPFNQVISSRPKYGMYVIHTTQSEVYDRLWCVDEVREASKNKIEITAIFDPHVWTLSDFKNSIKIETKNANCFSNSDKDMLTEKIEAAGGFDELDDIIRRFRRNSKRDLKMALAFETTFCTDVTDYYCNPKKTRSTIKYESNDFSENLVQPEIAIFETEENMEGFEVGIQVQTEESDAVVKSI